MKGKRKMPSNIPKEIKIASGILIKIEFDFHTVNPKKYILSYITIIHINYFRSSQGHPTKSYYI